MTQIKTFNGFYSLVIDGASVIDIYADELEAFGVDLSCEDSLINTLEELAAVHAE